jgi:hypothetical protein
MSIITKCMRFRNAFTEGFMEAAEFSTPTNFQRKGAPEYIDGTSARWTVEAKLKAKFLCEQFIDMNEADMEEANKLGVQAVSLGRLFWLTSAGHGTGLCDEKSLEAGDLGKRLAEAARKKPYLDVSISVWKNHIYFDA